jgi:hypothetical protein
VVIDPSSIQEASLSNNLVLTSGIAPLNSLTQPKITIEKGGNILRTNYVGAQPQSVIQLEYQPCVLTLKEIRDISLYVKESLIVKYFNAVQKSLEKKAYTIHF